MQQEETYGAAFLKHLTALGRQTPFTYSDLQQVKAMTQTELAHWLRLECREFSRVVLENTPEGAAAVVHKKRTEMAAAPGGWLAAQSAASFLELLGYMFSAGH